MESEKRQGKLGEACEELSGTYGELNEACV